MFGRDEAASDMKKVLVAASGSGGHLMPAKLITEELLKQGVFIEFIGSGKPLEEKIFGPLGIKQHQITISGLDHKGIFGIIKFLLFFPIASYQTLKLLFSFKPDCVVGVGGYASVLPVMFSSFFPSIRTWIHEAELQPGKANRLLSYFVETISLAFAEAVGFPEQKIVFTGHPLRLDVATCSARNLEQGIPKNLLVLGGSQGALSLDLLSKKLAPVLKERGMGVFHQCRPENVKMVTDTYKGAGVLEVRVMPFIHQLGEAYSWSDCIVCRAGAGTVLEVGVVNRPALFVPFPHAQGDHQAKNAQTLVGIGKALMVKEGEGFEERFLESFLQLLEPEHYLKIRDSPPVERPVNAAQRIAEGILQKI